MAKEKPFTKQYVEMVAGIGAGKSSRLYQRFYEKAELRLGVNRRASRSVRLKWDCQLRQCYCNCQKAAALEPDRFSYHEGFAYSPGLITTGHAWLVDRKTNRVVDPTWRFKGGKVDDETEYLGIEIPVDFAIDHSGSYMDAWIKWVDQELEQEGAHPCGPFPM